MITVAKPDSEMLQYKSSHLNLISCIKWIQIFIIQSQFILTATEYKCTCSYRYSRGQTRFCSSSMTGSRHVNKYARSRFSWIRSVWNKNCRWRALKNIKNKITYLQLWILYPWTHQVTKNLSVHCAVYATWLPHLPLTALKLWDMIMVESSDFIHCVVFSFRTTEMRSPY
jgi:hypothetical protein